MIGPSTEHQRCPVIPGFRQLLQEVHQQLCRHGGPVHGFDQERRIMVVGTISTTSLSTTEECDMHSAGVVVSKPCVTLYSGHRRIQNSCWRCTDARPRLDYNLLLSLVDNSNLWNKGI